MFAGVFRLCVYCLYFNKKLKTTIILSFYYIIFNISVLYAMMVLQINYHLTIMNHHL